jgi:hypothetical protein
MREEANMQDYLTTSWRALRLPKKFVSMARFRLSGQNLRIETRVVQTLRLPGSLARKAKLSASFPVEAGTLASLRGGTSGRSAWKGQENGQKRKTSGQTSGHARKFPHSPEEPCYRLVGMKDYLAMTGLVVGAKDC